MSRCALVPVTTAGNTEGADKVKRISGLLESALLSKMMHYVSNGPAGLGIMGILYLCD